jgi:purine-nucleoside phosphorylase
MGAAKPFKPGVTPLSPDRAYCSKRHGLPLSESSASVFDAAAEEPGASGGDAFDGEACEKVVHPAFDPAASHGRALPLDGRGDGSAEPLRNAPILEQDNPAAPSLFTAEAMLGLARLRKGLSACSAPDICVLDPDGDLEQYLQARGELLEDGNWGCFHTRLSVYQHHGRRCGIIGRAVGAAFSVLLAEQLFASGCKFLISLSSAGQIVDLGPPPYFVVIDRALRDEGTSYHYLRPSRFVDADGPLLERVLPALLDTGVALHVGASWTTDAPFRETAKTIAERRGEGVLTVEMEAAGLYAYAVAQGKAILCLAQVTNRLNCAPGDFAKGVADGAEAALELIGAAAAAWEDADAPSVETIRPAANASG